MANFDEENFEDVKKEVSDESVVDVSVEGLRADLLRRGVVEGSLEFGVLKALADKSKLTFNNKDIDEALEGMGHPGSFRGSTLVDAGFIQVVSKGRGKIPTVFGFFRAEEIEEARVEEAIDEVEESPIISDGDVILKSKLEEMQYKENEEDDKNILIMETEIKHIKAKGEIRNQVYKKILGKVSDV